MVSSPSHRRQPVADLQHRPDPQQDDHRNNGHQEAFPGQNHSNTMPMKKAA